MGIFFYPNIHECLLQLNRFHLNSLRWIWTHIPTHFNSSKSMWLVVGHLLSIVGFYSSLWFSHMVFIVVRGNNNNKCVRPLIDVDMAQFTSKWIEIEIRRRRDIKNYAGKFECMNFFLLFQSKLMSCLQMNTQNWLWALTLEKSRKKKHRRKNNFRYFFTVSVFFSRKTQIFSTSSKPITYHFRCRVHPYSQFNPQNNHIYSHLCTTLKITIQWKCIWFRRFFHYRCCLLCAIFFPLSLSLLPILIEWLQHPIRNTQ